MDLGEILINGEKAEIRSPRDARSYNIETIDQTLALADNLDTANQLSLFGRYISTPKSLSWMNQQPPLDHMQHKMVSELIQKLKAEGIGVFYQSRHPRCDDAV